MTATKTKGLEVIEQRTKLVAPHLDSTLTFLHPAYGPDTCANVGNAITEAGLYRPTMAETVSLAHAAFNSNDKYSDEIRKIMKNNWLWAFTGNLYVPNQGVFIEDNPKTQDGFIVMDKDSLVERLKQGDPSVRFVKFGFKTKEMTSLELGRNPYVINLVGSKEGAEKLAEIADKHSTKPYLWSFESVENPETRVSALDSSWYLDRRLDVYGYGRGDGRDGLAFGVQRTGEASHAEK